jgi:hypothetical protein
MIPVEGHPGLYRDPQTKAIINTNKTQYEQYVEGRNKKLERDQKVEQTAEEVKELKSEISEIKQLLLKLMSDINT